MCLHKINHLSVKPTNHVRVGWKYFTYRITKDDVKLYSVYQGEMSSLPKNEWITDEASGFISSDEIPSVSSVESDGTFKIEYLVPKYPTGFHIFTTLEGAKNSGIAGMTRKLFKVEYNYVVASGVDRNTDCVVAREMKILEEVKE